MSMLAGLNLSLSSISTFSLHSSLAHALNMVEAATRGDVHDANEDVGSNDPFQTTSDTDVATTGMSPGGRGSLGARTKAVGSGGDDIVREP